jgi:hypothetical protein
MSITTLGVWQAEKQNESKKDEPSHPRTRPSLQQQFVVSFFFFFARCRRNLNELSPISLFGNLLSSNETLGNLCLVFAVRFLVEWLFCKLELDFFSSSTLGEKFRYRNLQQHSRRPRSQAIHCASLPIPSTLPFPFLFFPFYFFFYFPFFISIFSSILSDYLVAVYGFHCISIFDGDYKQCFGYFNWNVLCPS